MAKCPKCGEEVLLESGGWDWFSSGAGFGMWSTSPFSKKLFACGNCGADSLAVRLIDIFIFRIMDFLPYFIFLSGLFASIPWLTLKTVWYFLLLYPLIFFALWGFVFYKVITNFWWGGMVQLKVTDDSGDSKGLGYIIDIAIVFVLFALGWQAVKFIVGHLFK